MDNGFNCEKNNQILHFLLFDLNHYSMTSLVKRDLSFTKIHPLAKLVKLDADTHMCVSESNY